MTSAVPVVVVGSGLAGTVAVEAITAREGLELTGWLTTSRSKAGRPIRELTEGADVVDRLTHVDDAGPVLDRARGGVLLYAGLNDVASQQHWFEQAALAGLDIVSVAGPIHPMRAWGEQATGRLRASASDQGVRMLSTGVNPGFLLDILPITCASLSPTGTVSIQAERRSDIQWWGPSVLEGYGLGRRLDEWHSTEAYVSLAESGALVADALRWRAYELTETYEPTCATSDTAVGELLVREGEVDGFVARCVVSEESGSTVTLQWQGLLCGTDRWRREGAPLHHLTISGDIDVKCSVAGSFLDDSYPATVGRALSSIEPLRSLAPGLYRPDQIPLSPVDLISDRL